MKRWNRKGTASAKLRMAELRIRKMQNQRAELAALYRARFGREWLTDAKAALTPAFEPMDRDARTQEHIDWLTAAISPDTAA